MTVFQTWQQTKVLLVDDNDMGREVLRALLETVGIEVQEAQNGLEAVDRVETEEFDLVLMDVQMPVLDGQNAARAIRALYKENIENLPIIAMTADSFAEHRAVSLAAGMNDHLTKPVNLEILYAMLKNWLPAEKQPSKQQSANATVSKELSEYAELEAAFPGIDIKGGIRRVAGDGLLYVDLLNKYVDQFSDTERELRKELALEDKKEAIYRVHTLRGVAGNLGVTAVYELASQLEEQLTKSQKVSAFDKMVKEHQRFLALVQSYLTRNQPLPVKDKPSGSESEMQTLLEQLLPFLKSIRPLTARPLLARLQEKNWPDKYQHQLTLIVEQIESYQLPHAAEQVENLLQSIGGE